MSPTKDEYLEALAEASVPFIAAAHRKEDPRPHLRAALAIEASDDLDSFMGRFYAFAHVLALQVPRDTTLSERTNEYHADVVAACRKTREAA